MSDHRNIAPSALSAAAPRMRMARARGTAILIIAYVNAAMSRRPPRVIQPMRGCHPERGLGLRESS